MIKDPLLVKKTLYYKRKKQKTKINKLRCFAFEAKIDSDYTHTLLYFCRSPIEKVNSFQRSVVIRTFITQDFMTGVPAIPGENLNIDVLNRMASDIRSVSGISRVLYDLTSKPPGTTEWEWLFGSYLIHIYSLILTGFSLLNLK